MAIGGVVRLTTPPAIVPNASVRLVELDQTVRTNAAGQFIFTGLRRGQYTLEAWAPGRSAVSLPIDVPTLAGEYDIYLN